MLQFNAISPDLGTLSGQIPKGVTGSETGQFDFMNYLLGLENLTADLMNPEASNPLLVRKNVPEEGEAKDPLLELFEGQGNPLWNPLFPNGTSEMAKPAELSASAENRQPGEFNGFQKLGLDSKGDQKLEMSDLEGKTAPREIGEESTEAFLQVREDMKTSSEAMPSKKFVIPKYAPSQEDVRAAGNAESGESQRASVKSFDRAEVETGSQEPVLHSNVVREMPEEVRKTEKGNRRDHDLVAFDSTVRSSASAQGLEKHEVNDSKPVAIPEVFQKVESMIHHGGGKMTVSLTPPELGRVDIEVIARGKNVEIKVQSENDIAKVAIEGKLADLKHSMQLQDLNLSRLEVQVGSHKPELDTASMAGFNSNLNMGAQSQQDFRQFSGNSERTRQNEQTSTRSNVSMPAPVAQAAGMSALAPGRVDIRI